MEKRLQLELSPPPYPGPPLDYNSAVSQPSVSPAVKPYVQTQVQPQVQTVVQQIVQPVIQPTVQPMVQPIVQPVIQPIVQPVVQPIVQPVVQPIVQPVVQPILQPVNQVVVMQNPPKDVPGQMICSRCRTNVVTRIEHKIGGYTWLVCGLLTLFMCWPCYIIPFFVKDCKDVVHSCPCCNTVLHIHKRI